MEIDDGNSSSSGSEGDSSDIPSPRQKKLSADMNEGKQQKPHIRSSTNIKINDIQANVRPRFFAARGARNNQGMASVEHMLQRQVSDDSGMSVWGCVWCVGCVFFCFGFLLYASLQPS